MDHLTRNQRVVGSTPTRRTSFRRPWACGQAAGAVSRDRTTGLVSGNQSPCISTAPLPPRPHPRQPRKCRALDRQVLGRHGHRSTSRHQPNRCLGQCGSVRCPFASGAESGVVVPVLSSTSRTAPASRFSTRSGMTVWWAEREPTSSSLAPLDVVGHLHPGSSREDAEGKPAQVSLARPGPAPQPQSGRTGTSPGLGSTGQAGRQQRTRL
jgi:hypothetical protein